MKQTESICRSCFHSYVCEQFNEHRDSHNDKCHFFNDHFVDAADVVEVVHGEWVQIEYDEMMDKITCSHCKEKWSIIDNCTETFNYCPNCGAKMDGERKDT